MACRFRALPRSFAFAVLTSVTLAWGAGRAEAAWPSDPSGNLPLCTAAGGQYYPTIIPDGSGGAIFTWADERGGNSDIYAQRVNAAGVPQWTANGVALCTAADGQASPTIVSDGVGGAIVTWQDWRVGGPGSDIYAQRVSGAGVPQWTANGVALCTATDRQNWPMIVSDGSGGAIVTWYDYRSGTSYDIYAQRVNAAGIPQWAVNGAAMCTAAEDQFSPTIASDGAGGAIVTWYDYRAAADADIYAQRLNAAGVSQWTANGVALCAAPWDQGYPTIVPDGTGGAIVTWYDARGGSHYDIYAQRLNAAGLPQWTANGVALCAATNNQVDPMIAPDGSGGAIVTWQDWRTGTSDVYAQRVNPSGVPQWTANGVALCAITGNQFRPMIAADGSGGAIVTWYDFRNAAFYDIYAQRVSSAGAPQWTANGAVVCTAADHQINPSIASDDAGGAIIAWQDLRTVVGYDIYAQRINRFGLLGTEPTILSVRDVPNDQGKQVRLLFGRSALDSPGSPTPITGYQVYRRQIVVGSTQQFDASSPSARPAKAAILGWDFVMTLPARGDSFYQVVVPTLVDSSSTGIHRTAFFVAATTATPTTFFDSAPDSGHSVDNLPPAPPAAFTAAYASGATHLHWGPNPEPDFWYYKLHRGSTSNFTPGPGNQIASRSDTGYVDSGPAGSYYKISAVDAAGNESGYSLVTPAATTGVSAGVPRATFLAAPSPNPARGSTMIRFGLDRDGPISLRIYDVNGRLVRDLAEGTFTAGEYAMAWDLRDRSGDSVSGGIFFARLSAGRTIQDRRFVVVR